MNETKPLMLPARESWGVKTRKNTRRRIAE